MHPVLITLKLFGRQIEIASYGVCISTGILLATILCIYRAKPFFEKPGDLISDLLFYLLIPGFLGARLFYIIAEYKHFFEEPMSYIFSRSGFVFYGGLIFGILGSIVFCKLKKIDWKRLGDICVPGLGIAHGFGRLGCFFNGCCYGKECSAPWGVQFYQLYEHNIYKIDGLYFPVQLIEVAFAFLMALGSYLIIRKESGKKGLGLLTYLTGYAIFRFIIEFFRGDNRGLSFLHLSISQLISIGLLVIVFLVRRKFYESVTEK